MAEYHFTFTDGSIETVTGDTIEPTGSMVIIWRDRIPVFWGAGSDIMHIRRTEETEEPDQGLAAALAEARQWARHGYEIGQRHCGWTDHGVAPQWLTDGWPRSIDSCEHLKLSADFDTRITRARALHRAADYRAGAICAECSALDDQGTTDATPVPWPCATIQALS